MFFGDEEDMDSVVINEAVELVKKFGGEDDYQFVNGVLGSLARERAGLLPEEELENAPLAATEEDAAENQESEPTDAPEGEPESDSTC